MTPNAKSNIDPDFRYVLADKLRDLYYHYNTRQAVVAYRTGISAPKLSDIKNGRQDPTEEQTGRLLKYINRKLNLGLSGEELFAKGRNDG